MLRNALIGMILLGGVSGALGSGQTTTTTPQQPVPHIRLGPHNVVDPTGSDTPISSLEQQQAILRDKERQQKLVTDTNKLLELATDLKSQVDKTNRGIMSVDVIKKAEEIEKLAHSVKERMKG